MYFFDKPLNFISSKIFYRKFKTEKLVYQPQSLYTLKIYIHILNNHAALLIRYVHDSLFCKKKGKSAICFGMVIVLKFYFYQKYNTKNTMLGTINKDRSLSRTWYLVISVALLSRPYRLPTLDDIFGTSPIASELKGQVKVNPAASPL